MTIEQTKSSNSSREVEKQIMPYVLQYFKKSDESYVGDILLPEAPIKKLQEIFQVSENNPLYNCFPIQKVQAKFFKEEYNIHLDLDSAEYFLTFHAENDRLM